MKLWMKKDHGSSLGLVLIFVTIAGMWLGAILLLLQVTSNGPSLTNNEAAAAAKVTAGVLDQLKKDPTIGSAAVSPTKCTGLTTAVTSGYTVTCVPVSPSGNSGSPAGVVTTGTGANPGVDFGTTVTGPLTFDNGLTSTGPITVDPAAFVPVVTPNTPTCATNPLLCGSNPSGGTPQLLDPVITITATTPWITTTNATQPISATSTNTVTPIVLSLSANSTNCSLSGTTLKALSQGASCVIVADQAASSTYNAGSNSQTITIDISSVSNSGLQQVKFNPNPHSMEVGEGTQAVSASAYLFATNTGINTGTITYSSSPSGVCTNSGAVVTAVAVGTCTLTATSPAGTVSSVSYTSASTQAVIKIYAADGDESGGDTSGCSSDRSNKGANSGKKNSDSSTNSYYAGNGASGNSWNNNTDSNSNSWNNNKYFTTGSSSSAWSGADNYSGFSYGQDGSQYIEDHCGDQGGDGSSEGDHAHHRYGDNDCDIRGTSCTEEDESDNVSSHTAQTVTSKCTSGAVTIALTAGDYDSTDIIELNKFLSPTGFTSSTTYSTTSGSGCKPSSSTVTVTLGDGEYQFSGSTALVLNNALALVKNANATMNGRTCTYTGGVSTMPKRTNGKSAGVLQSQLHGVVVNMAVDLTITAGEWDLCGLNNPTGLNYAFKNATPTQGDLVTSREGSTFRPVTSSTYNTLTVGPNGTFRIVGAVDAQWTSFQWTQNPTKPSFITQEAIFKAAHLTTTAASSYSVPFGPGSGREVQITLINTKTGVKKSMIVFIDDVNGASVGNSVRILSSTL